MNYIFSSPVILSSNSDDTIKPTQDIVDAINDRIDHDETDLAEYLSEALDMIVSSITMEVRLGINGIIVDGITCRTTCEVEKELKPGLLNNLSDYISGQFSDGWGESFEQQEFSIDGGEEFYAEFWSEDKWSLDVVVFSKA